METYRIQIGDCVRQLPICPINENLSIAGFVMLGDVELTEACAKELLKICPEHDIIVTALRQRESLWHMKWLVLAVEITLLHEKESKPICKIPCL